MADDQFSVLDSTNIFDKPQPTQTPPTQPPTQQGGPPTPQQVQAKIQQVAQDLKIDPKIALAISNQESQGNVGAVGDGGSSYGPFQLHYTGQGAMGDNFTRDTGLHAQDPSTWERQIEYALQQAATGGWGPWRNTINKLGLREWSGINSPAGRPDFLPPWMTRPDNRFSPFIKSQPIMDHSQWGVPETFPKLPTEWEIPGIYQGVGQFFGQNGTQFTGPLGMMLAKFSADYKIGQQQGREEMLKYQAEQIRVTSAALELQQQRVMHEYADTFDMYALADPEAANDPARMNKSINGVDVSQALINKAMELGDDKMATMVATQGVGAAMKWNALRAAHLNDLMKANTKATEGDAEDAAWGFGSAPSTSNDPSAQFGPQAQTPSGGTPAAPAPPAGSPASRPGPAASPTSDVGALPPSNQVASNDPAAQFAQPEAQGSGGQPAAPGESDWDALVDDGVRGTIESTGMGPKTKAALMRSVAHREAQMQHIIDDPRATPESIDRNLRAISPSLADDLQNIVNYHVPVGGTSGSTGSAKEMAYFKRMASLAQKMNPNWDQVHYQQIQQFGENNGQTQRTLQKAHNVARMGQEVLDALKLIPDNQSEMQTMVNNWKGGLGVDYRYSQLFAAWRTYNMEVNTLVAGSPTVTETEGQIGVVPQLFGTKQGYLGALRAHMDQAQGALEGYRNRWQQLTGADRSSRPMPGDDPDAFNQIGKLKLVDPITGTLPGGTWTSQSGKTYRYKSDPPNKIDPEAIENWERVQAQ